MCCRWWRWHGSWKIATVHVPWLFCKKQNSKHNRTMYSAALSEWIFLHCFLIFVLGIILMNVLFYQMGMDSRRAPWDWVLMLLYFHVVVEKTAEGFYLICLIITLMLLSQVFFYKQVCYYSFPHLFECGSRPITEPSHLFLIFI